MNANCNHRGQGQALCRFSNRWIEDHETGCWNWQGAETPTGYGKMWVNGKLQYVHRFSFELFKFKIPGKLFVLHRCDNTSCVNPGHLFLGTPKVNLMDCSLKGRTRNQKKTHCINGHKFTKQNTIDRKEATAPGKIYRRCRKCDRNRRR